ncbi:MAG: hypothetical protein PHO67_02945 [Candidatus Omnitrophica bacterium]|nr:hypothetical protein [Candidatus Omnitrophota bacterium]
MNDYIACLLSIAANGLEAYYDPQTSLFSFIVTDLGRSPEKANLLLTHSLISLLGISNYKESVHIDFSESKNRVYEQVAMKSGLRESALLLWLLAKENDPRSDIIFGKICALPSNVIINAETMEVAWLLTSLVFYAHQKRSEKTGKTMDAVSQHLKKRFNCDTCLFYHRPRNSFFSSFDIRYDIANFADQIYSIYAFALYYGLKRDGESLQISEQCADKICSLQGKQGQWWWHYNVPRGTVIQKYPVYSVHQDSMAPFALMELNKVSQKDYSSSISLGLQWLFSENELNVKLANEEKNYVRRGIQRKRFLAKLINVRTLVFKFMKIDCLSGYFDQPKYLCRMNWEYSYHLGWILYAYSPQTENLWRKF